LGRLSRLTAKRIALIKPSALGDIVHALPVLTALRRRFPCAHLTWVVNRTYEPLLRDHPHLDAVLSFERHPFRGGWRRGCQRLIDFWRRLRQARFDLAIDLQGLLRTGVIALASGARRRIGLTSAREGAAWCCTDLVDDRTGCQHAVDRYWRVIEALGGGGRKEFIVPIQPEARAWCQTVVTRYPRPWLAASVGARWATKRWPPAHFGELLRRATESFGGAVFFVGAADEADLAEQAGRTLACPWVNLAGRTALPQLAALLDAADVVLANDSGPLHLAAALGKPVLAPYTCTVVDRHGPYGQESRGVATTVACAGSYLRACDRLDCMNDLTPDRLWPHLHDHLLTWQRQSRSA
jgi:ADP-heptose:LPS heptosyltransferase